MLQQMVVNIKEKVIINIDKYGNTTAGTIPIAINEAVEDGRVKDGDYILLASFGAGFLVVFLLNGSLVV